MRLAAATLLVVFVTGVLTFLVSQAAIEHALLPQRLEELSAHAASQAQDLDDYVRVAGVNVRGYAAGSAVDGIVRAVRAGGVDPIDRVSTRVWRDRLERRFFAEAEANVAIDQLRFIGLADGGREIVRVDRHGPGGMLRITPQSELQRKGDRPYFIATAQMARGEVYYSPIELNREFGKIETPDNPVLRASTPVFDARGRRFGMIVVNYKMQSALERAVRPQVQGGRVYIINAAGQYLAHPDPGRSFGFERGRVDDVAKDFAGVDVLARNSATAAMANGRAIVSQPVLLAGATPVVLIEAAPRSSLLAPLRQIFTATAWAVAAAALLASLFGLLVARSIAAPIERMARAVGEGDVAMEGAFPEIRELGAALREAQRAGKMDALLRAYAERDRLFIATVESSTDAVLTLTLDGIITSWNHGAEQLYGYSAEDIVGRSIELVVPEERLVQLRESLAQIAKGERVPPHETERVRRDGTFFDVSVSLSPIKGPDGAVIGASKIARDISVERRRERQFAAAIEAAPSGMLIVMPDGAIAFANSEAERLFGYTREVLVTMNVDALVPEPSRANHNARSRAYFSAPGRMHMGAERDLRALRQDGSEFPAEIGLNPMETDDGLAVLVVVVDITERKRAEAAIQAKTEELERSNADLQQFAYVASHDLQEPLRMVASYTQLLSEMYKGKLDERADKFIGYTVEGAVRMRALIADLLAYSRLAASKHALEPINVAAITAETVREMAGAVKAANGTIEVGDLPPALGVSSQVRQIVQNLLSNAIKFRGAAPPHVQIEGVRNGEFVTYVVRDNGIGIAEEHRGKIFQMFQRLHAREAYEGSGIGLAIVKKAVERHGGRVWLESELGKGTNVYFTLRAA